METFYLGTHQPAWLGRIAVPLFVSHLRLAGRRSLPRARAPWLLDSGGFSVLSAVGRWTIGPREYASAVGRYAEGIGHLAGAAVQDWMCEPSVLARTGLDVAEHQRRTVASYLGLRELAPDLPWLPVLQGYTLDDYRRCHALYDAAGVDLAAAPLVMIGSMCRRQGTAEASVILAHFAGEGIRLHALGYKITGLRRDAACLVSADSLAWSYDARRRPPLAGHGHKNCANCLTYALWWRERVVGELDRPRQLRLPLGGAAEGRAMVERLGA